MEVVERGKDYTVFEDIPWGRVKVYHAVGEHKNDEPKICGYIFDFGKGGGNIKLLTK